MIIIDNNFPPPPPSEHPRAAAVRRVVFNREIKAGGSSITAADLAARAVEDLMMGHSAWRAIIRNSNPEGGR